MLWGPHTAWETEVTQRKRLIKKLMLTDGLIVIAKQKQGGVRGIKITPYQHREMYQTGMDLDMGQ